jgi:hypothetical protein
MLGIEFVLELARQAICHLSHTPPVLQLLGFFAFVIFVFIR